MRISPNGAAATTWADANFYISDDVTSLSNCCRLVSDIRTLGFFNSIGGTALEVGSVKVNTANLARLAYEHDREDYIPALKEQVLLCLKALDCVRHIIARNVEKGLLPNYALGVINLESQYNTIGIIGLYEALQKFGYTEAEGELNRYFYQVVYSCLEWDKKQYVSGFNIYEHDLNWTSHNIFREGYLFMGLPGERSTAQPERDFYIHIMPPYGKNTPSRNDVDDEVYFYFKGNDDLKESMRLYTAAMLQAEISEGKDKEAYLGKAAMLRKKIIKYLNESKNTCFDVVYKKRRQMKIATC